MFGFQPHRMETFKLSTENAIGSFIEHRNVAHKPFCWTNTSFSIERSAFEIPGFIASNHEENFYSAHYYGL